MANNLMPYIKDKQDEADLAFLKQRVVNVDGYEISIYFNKEHFVNFSADEEGEREEFDLMSLQLYSKHIPFLPFHVLCYLATKFLGGKELGLSEFVVMGRKVYIWSVAVDEHGETIPIPLHPHVKSCSYDGMDYSHAPVKQVIFNLPSAPS